jgi:hypothetical protein
MTTLSDLYDGDRRHRDPEVARLAVLVAVPHPLHGVRYGDGVLACTHARRCTTPVGPAVRA